MFNWLKRKSQKKQIAGQVPTEGRMYDLRNCCWGHSIVFSGDGKQPHTRKVCGWLTPYASKGDTFLFPATKGMAVFQFIDIKNCDDPRDMFFGTVGIIRYATEADLKKVNEPKTKYNFV